MLGRTAASAPRWGLLSTRLRLSGVLPTRLRFSVLRPALGSGFVLWAPTCSGAQCTNPALSGAQQLLRGGGPTPATSRCADQSAGLGAVHGRSVPLPGGRVPSVTRRALDERIGKGRDGRNDLGEVERQVVSVRGQAGAIGAVGGGPGGCELANCGTERAQRRAAVGSRGQQCGSGSPEIEPVDPSECVQVDVVANACVSLTQLHCGAEFLGENRDNRIAEDLDGRSVEQVGSLMVAGPGVTGSPKFTSSLSLILAEASEQSNESRTPR